MILQSLDRGLQALNILANRESISVTELAKELDIDKSTVSRIMETLRQHDMVQMDKTTRKYRLGFRILYLGERLSNYLEVIDIARPILMEVSRLLGQSVHLCAYSRNMVYVIDQIVSNLPYTMSARVGMIEPIHSSSVGKCIMAYRPQDKVDELLADYEMTPYTEKTITDKAELLAQYDMIRGQGYAVDDEEMFLNVRCIAVPIFDYHNNVRYAIGISGPIGLMSSENLSLYKKKLESAARKIGAKLK